MFSGSSASVSSSFSSTSSYSQSPSIPPHVHGMNGSQVHNGHQHQHQQQQHQQHPTAHPRQQQHFDGELYRGVTASPQRDAGAQHPRAVHDSLELSHEELLFGEDDSVPNHGFDHEDAGHDDEFEDDDGDLLAAVGGPAAAPDASPVRGSVPMTPTQSVPLVDIVVREEEAYEARVNRTRGSKRKVCVADFELLAVVGRGAFGKVFQVRHVASHKIYAMKVLRKDKMKKPKDIVHTRSERDVLEAVRSAFVVNLRFAFQTDTKLYLILDYVPGGELFTLLDEQQVISEEEARFYVAELVVALEHLHSLNIIYRDLKPENILLDEQGHVCLTDFGFAKAKVTELEATRTFCGTVQYMAPEVVRKTGHGKPADWWSLGCLLYEMLAGKTPFDSSNRKKIQHNIVNKKIRMPKMLSGACRSILKGLLRRTASRRLGSVNGAQELKEHAWFRGIDWDQVEQRMLRPPYVPELDDITDVSRFDEQFTSEKPIDSPAHGPVSTSGSFKATGENHFQGFSYVRSPMNTPAMAAVSETPTSPEMFNLAASPEHAAAKFPPPALGFARASPSSIGEAAAAAATGRSTLSSLLASSREASRTLAASPIRGQQAAPLSSFGSVPPHNRVRSDYVASVVAHPRAGSQAVSEPSPGGSRLNPNAADFVPS